jgi:nucleotide-binding universal stress UspA family protein
VKSFGKIMAPIDFSPTAAEGMRLAVDMAQRYEASLTLVHVYQPVAYPFPEGYVLYTPQQMASLLTEVQKLLEGALKEVRAAGAGRADTKLLQGVAASEIVTFAQEENYDLIVIGTHGRTGIQHALLGSVAEKVVRRAPCPVLTVRAKESSS